MMTIFDSSVDRLKHLYALKFDFKTPGFKRTLAKLIACKCDATLRFKVLKAPRNDGGSELEKGRYLLEDDCMGPNPP